MHAHYTIVVYAVPCAVVRVLERFNLLSSYSTEVLLAHRVGEAGMLGQVVSHLVARILQHSSPLLSTALVLAQSLDVIVRVVDLGRLPLS